MKRGEIAPSKNFYVTRLDMEKFVHSHSKQSSFINHSAVFAKLLIVKFSNFINQEHGHPSFLGVWRNCRGDCRHQEYLFWAVSLFCGRRLEWETLLREQNLIHINTIITAGSHESHPLIKKVLKILRNIDLHFPWFISLSFQIGAGKVS